MKNISIKIKVLTGVIFGIIIGSSITAYAVGITAKDITYKKNNTEITVEQALNELYSNSKKDFKKINLIASDVILRTTSQGGYTVDCSSIENYDKLTVDDFLFEFVRGAISSSGSVEEQTFSITKNYNPSTGILEINRPSLPKLTPLIYLNVYVVY